MGDPGPELMVSGADRVLNLHGVSGDGPLCRGLQEAELLEEGGESEFGPGGPRGPTETGGGV